MVEIYIHGIEYPDSPKENQMHFLYHSFPDTGEIEIYAGVSCKTLPINRRYTFTDIDSVESPQKPRDVLERLSNLIFDATKERFRTRDFEAKIATGETEFPWWIIGYYPDYSSGLTEEDRIRDEQVYSTYKQFINGFWRSNKLLKMK